MIKRLDDFFEPLIETFGQFLIRIGLVMSNEELEELNRQIKNEEY